MERTEVLKRLESIIREVVDNETITINEQTKAEDVEDWDSLANVQIVVGMQKEFGKKFTAKDILEWKTVSDMIDSVMK